MNNKDRQMSRFLSMMVLALLGCILMVMPVLAEGTGDGSGGGKDIPLDLVSSSPADGQKDVALSGDIKLSFNKNVIYLLIRDANKACISLTTAEGSKVPMEVIMADDQTPEGFAQRRDIYVHPVQKLEPGTAYVVKVSSQFGAKNGTFLGHEDSVHFVTAGGATKPAETPQQADTSKEQTSSNPAAVPTSVSNAAVTTQPGSPTSEKAQGTGEQLQATEDQTASAAEPLQNKQGANTPYAVAAGLIILAALGYVYFKKRSKR